MKEAIGGTWLFGIVLAFIVLFTTFISLSTNYSRCFRIKDEIINTIEHYNGVNPDSLTKISEFLNGIGYSSTSNCPTDDPTAQWHGFTAGVNDKSTGTNNANYCIAKFTITDSYKVSAGGNIKINGPIGHPRSAYYQVAVFFKLNWPIIEKMFTIQISGETKIIYNWNDISALS